MSGAERKGRVRVLGLDPSLTSFGVARLTYSTELSIAEGETDLWKTKRRGVERLDWFAERLVEEVRDFYPHMVLIEGYAYAKGNQAHQIGELGGVLRLELFRQEITPVVVPPAKLKKFVTGKGNAPKDLMMLEVYKRFGADCPTSDEADAVALAYLGAAHFGFDAGLPKANMEILEGVEFTRAHSFGLV